MTRVARVQSTSRSDGTMSAFPAYTPDRDEFMVFAVWLRAAVAEKS
jgi:hypothetical protein